VKIAPGARVRIKVKLQVAGGDVIEESVVEYFQGAGTMMPGLEKALANLEAGASKSGVIAANEAFDAVGTLPTKTIPRAEFPKDIDLKEGSVFGAKGPHGEDVSFVVTELTADTVKVRFQHPLAGKSIGYEVSVLSVSDPLPPPMPGEAIALDEEA